MMMNTDDGTDYNNDDYSVLIKIMMTDNEWW